MTTQSNHVVIIGGGIIGGLSAYFLNQKNWSVTLLEKDHFGSGASHGNCGLVVPSHSQPLNNPDNLIKGIGWMFKKDAPLFIPWRFDADWIRWVLQFVRHCFGSSHQGAISGRSALMADAIDCYDTLIKKEAIDCNWQISGNIHLFKSAKSAQSFAAAHTHKKSRGQRLAKVPKQQINEMIPAITPGITTAWHDPLAASMRPDKMMKELARVLHNKGVTICENTQWYGFEAISSRVRAARTSRGLFPADAFVLATGAWTPLYSKQLGNRIPIQPGTGYSVTVKRPENAPALPCFFETERVVVTPWPDALRIGGTLTFSGHDIKIRQERIAALFKTLARYMPITEEEEGNDQWSGWRPMTWDGLPVIDYLPQFNNVILATGHNELGITMGPATGQIVAKMVNGERLPALLSYYNIARFSGLRR